MLTETSRGYVLSVNDTRVRWGRYFAVLASAVACYTALGAVLRELPDYVGDRLGGSPIAVGFAVGAPALTGALLRPFGGRAADTRGPRAVMIIGACLMAIGVVPAFVTALAPLLVSRLLVGAGEALMMSAAVLWLMRIAGPSRRGEALGHIGLANYAGLTIGPLLVPALGLGSDLPLLWTLAAVLPLAGAVGARTLGYHHEAKRANGETVRGSDGVSIARATLRPGLGLLLVNVGYVAVLSFGARAARAHGVGIAALVVPVFGAGVIASRTVLRKLPDRLGGGRALVIAVGLESLGLAALALAHSTAVAIAALAVMALGQGLAVPSLGLLALAAIPAHRHGAAAGAFFAYFDAGVGLGGPAVGLAAELLDPGAALIAAAVAVAVAAPVALIRRRDAADAVDPAPAAADVNSAVRRG